MRCTYRATLADLGHVGPLVEGAPEDQGSHLGDADTGQSKQ